MKALQLKASRYKTCYKVCYKCRLAQHKTCDLFRGRYSVRVTVPAELRVIIGKRELDEPLGADKKTAERKAHGVIAGFLANLEDARAKLEARRPTISSVVKKHYHESLAHDVRERFDRENQPVLDLPGESVDIGTRH